MAKAKVAVKAKAKVNVKVKARAKSSSGRKPAPRIRKTLLPCEEIVRLIHGKYVDRNVSFEEISDDFALEKHPNYYAGLVLSAFDLCRVWVTSDKQIDLPQITVSIPQKERGESQVSFIDQYIREISVFPTLSHEQEVALAKLMEVAYLRYKSGLFFCPVVLDWIDEEFQQMAANPVEGHKYNLSRFKELIVPGVTKLSYPQMWRWFTYAWEKVRSLRQQIRQIEESMASRKNAEEAMIKMYVCKFTIAFYVKDLHIRESYFHELRKKLIEKRDAYARYRHFIQNIDARYQRYIELKNLLVNYNLRLVLSISRKFFRPAVPPMDIVQYGNQGLIRAAEDFNYKLNFKFSTYAIWWIRQKIQEGIQEQERLIRIPAYRLHLSRKYSHIRDKIPEDAALELLAENGESAHEADDDPGANLQHLPHAFVMTHHSSDDDDDEGGNGMLDHIIDKRSEEESNFDEDARTTVRTHLRLYSSRERYILILRYGLPCEDIVPQGITVPEFERTLGELSQRRGEGDGAEKELPDRIVDEEMRPVIFQFVNLPSEERVSPADFSRIKKKNRAPKALIQHVIPHDPAQIADLQRRLNAGEALGDREMTLLALYTGHEFSHYVTLRPKDRLVLKRVWLTREVPASVARRIISCQGLILDHVAGIFGLTKERVRQIEGKILRNISYHLVLP